MTDKKDGYLGNANLKTAGTNIEFTKEQIEEYLKCSEDPIYFIKKYVKIVSLDEGLVPFSLYNYQEDMVNTIHTNRFTIGKLPRQSGKSSTVVAYLLHYVLFNQSMSVAILANKLATAREILSRLRLTYEYIPIWLQQGIVVWNKGSIELENGSKIIASATSSSAVRGGSYNFLLLDEFGHVPQNVAEEFFSSVYPTITSGRTTKVAIISTPNGLNMFYHYWRGATKKPDEHGKNDYVPIEVHWTQVPKYPGGPLRDEEWKHKQIQNTSESQFNSEFECDFIGSTNTLISSSKLHSLNYITPMHNNNDGLVIYEEAKEDHIYVMSIDTARGQGLDYSAFIVIDATTSPYKVVCRFKNNTIAPMVYPTIIRSVAEKYNKAYCLIEINDIGGQVADILFQDLEYENVLQAAYKGRGGQVIGSGFGGSKIQLGVRTTIPVKKLGCSILKSLIENDKLIIEDMDTVNELYTFVAKGPSFQADDGHNDDLVMCLVLFSWLSRQEYFKNLTNIDIRKDIYEDEMNLIEDELLPFGFISSQDEEETTFFDGKDVWNISNDWSSPDEPFL